jgi:hypothetical protein
MMLKGTKIGMLHQGPSVVSCDKTYQTYRRKTNALGKGGETDNR